LPPPSWRVVLLLALPVLAQQGLNFAVNFSDGYLAGHIGAASAQAAQANAHYLAWAITCYSLFVTVGSTALVSRFVGAGDRALAVAVTHQSLLVAAGLGGLATAVALGGGLEWLLWAMRMRGEASDLAMAFLQPLFALLVFQTLESAGIACLVGAGDTRTGMWVMAGVALVNVPLAWGFGYGFGPLPALGFRGIAVGTALSHLLGAIVVLTVLARGRSGLKLHAGLFRPRLGLIWRLLRVSVPAGFDGMLVVVGQLWFLSIVNALGDETIGAHGIALRWEALGYLSGAAFGTAAMTLVGQNLGARRPDRATKSGWLAFGLGCGVMSTMGVIFLIFAPHMFRLFCPKPEQAPIIELGVPALRLVAFAMPPLASTIVFTFALRGAGDTRVPVLFTWVGFFLVRLPLAYVLTGDGLSFGPLGSVPGLGLGLLGAWWAMLADLAVRGVFFFVRFARGSWKWQTV
jgi:putative MATE family efflux protein